MRAFVFVSCLMLAGSAFAGEPVNPADVAARQMLYARSDETLTLATQVVAAKQQIEELKAKVTDLQKALSDATACGPSKEQNRDNQP